MVWFCLRLPGASAGRGLGNGDAREREAENAAGARKALRSCGAREKKRARKPGSSKNVKSETTLKTNDAELKS